MGDIAVSDRSAEVVVVAQRPPSANHAWVGGHWTWRGGKDVWTPGRHVVRPSAGAAWIGGAWVKRGPRWVWKLGTWR